MAQGTARVLDAREVNDGLAACAGGLDLGDPCRVLCPHLVCEKERRRTRIGEEEERRLAQQAACREEEFAAHRWIVQQGEQCRDEHGGGAERGTSREGRRGDHDEIVAEAEPDEACGVTRGGTGAQHLAPRDLLRSGADGGRRQTQQLFHAMVAEQNREPVDRHLLEAVHDICEEENGLWSGLPERGEYPRDDCVADGGCDPSARKIGGGEQQEQAPECYRDSSDAAFVKRHDMFFPGVEEERSVHLYRQP